MKFRVGGRPGRMTPGPCASVARAGSTRAGEETFYPPRLPARRWLEHYANRFDTVEVNSTFYRLAKPAAVDGWVHHTPHDFLFALKASRYLTHMKRLTDMDRGVGRYYESIAPLAESPKLGPVLWQLPDSFRRDDDRLGYALSNLPPGRHAFELRHPSWFAEPVYALLRDHGAAFVIHDDRRRQPTPEVLTTDWTYLRFHYGRRGHRGNYSETGAARVGRAGPHAGGAAEVFAYFNNDWEVFAPRNAKRLRKLVEGVEHPGPLVGCDHAAGWSSQVARRAHNPKVAGSNPAPAIGSPLSPGGFHA